MLHIECTDVKGGKFTVFYSIRPEYVAIAAYLLIVLKKMQQMFSRCLKKNLWQPDSLRGQIVSVSV